MVPCVNCGTVPEPLESGVGWSVSRCNCWMLRVTNEVREDVSPACFVGMGGTMVTVENHEGPPVLKVGNRSVQRIPEEELGNAFDVVICSMVMGS